VFSQCLLPRPAACAGAARAEVAVPLISTLKKLQSFQPSTHSPFQNVDQINPERAAMFSLDNQLTVQVLKTDTLVSSPSQTPMLSAAVCLILSVL